MRSAFSLAVSAVLLFSFLLTSFVPVYALKPAGLEESEEGKKQIAKALLASDPGVSHAPQLFPLRAGLENPVTEFILRYQAIQPAANDPALRKEAIAALVEASDQVAVQQRVLKSQYIEITVPSFSMAEENGPARPTRLFYDRVTGELYTYTEWGQPIQTGLNPVFQNFHPLEEKEVVPGAMQRPAQQAAAGTIEKRLPIRVFELKTDSSKPEERQLSKRVLSGEIVLLVPRRETGLEELAARSVAPPKAGLEEIWDRTKSDGWVILRGQSAGRALLQWLAVQEPQRQIALVPASDDGLVTRPAGELLPTLTAADLVAVTPDGRIGVVREKESGREARPWFDRLAVRSDWVLTRHHLRTAGVDTSPVILVISTGGTKQGPGAVTHEGLVGPPDQQAPVLNWQQLGSERPADVSPLQWSAHRTVRLGSDTLAFHKIYPDRVVKVINPWAGPGIYLKGRVGNEKLKPYGLHPPVDYGAILESETEAQWGRRVQWVFVHDAAAAAMGEMNLPKGALYGKRHGMSFVDGTGVGLGVILNGQPLYAIAGVLEGALGEFGWHMVRLPAGKYVWRGEGATLENPFPNRPKQGEWSIEQAIGGPWRAARFVQITRDNEFKDKDLFGQKIDVEDDDLVDMGETRRKWVRNEEQQRKVLVAVTELAKGEGKLADLARQFIRDTGTEFGTAIGAFRARFAGQPFVDETIVIGSTLGQNFGLVKDGSTEDLYLDSIRKAAGTQDIVRSRLEGYQREFFVELPPSGLEEVEDVLRDIDELEPFFLRQATKPQRLLARPILLDASEDRRVAVVAQALSLMMLKESHPERLNFRLILDKGVAADLLREMTLINPIAARDILQSRIVRYGEGDLTLDAAKARALSELAEEAGFATVRDLEDANVLLVVGRSQMTLDLLQLLRSFFLDVQLEFSPRAFERLRALLQAA